MTTIKCSPEQWSRIGRFHWVKQPVKMICGMLKNSLNILFMVISNTFHKIISSKNYTQVPSQMSTFVFYRSFANYVLITWFETFEEYDNCLLNIGNERTAFHLYEYHKKNLQLLSWGHGESIFFPNNSWYSFVNSLMERSIYV